MSERPSTASLGSGLTKHRSASHRKARPRTAHSSIKKGRKARDRPQNSHIVHANRRAQLKRPKSGTLKSNGRRQKYGQKTTFRSWRQFPEQNSLQLKQKQRLLPIQPASLSFGGIAHRPVPSSPEEIVAAHETWRDINVTSLEMSPLRAVSSESIMLQQAVQKCVDRLATADYGDAELVFSQLAGHTFKCLSFLERNLSSITEESTSVNVCQQAMHALSHSTVLKRVWHDVKEFIGEAANREAQALEKHKAEMEAMRESYEARISTLEKRVVDLKPEPLPEVRESEESDSETENDALGDVRDDDTHASGGIVGKFTLDARDRNRNRRYSDADSRLGDIHKSLLKVHESQVAQEMTTRSRLEMRQEQATKERLRINSLTPNATFMNPASRHVMLESFMKMLGNVDETCKIHMLEELFMCFKGEQRLAALAGMLDQVSRTDSEHLLGDVLCGMPNHAQAHYLHVLVKMCDAQTKEMLLENICASLKTERVRELLNDQIDMLPPLEMLGIMEDLVAESLQEKQRLTFVDNICAYLSPAEKRDCIVHMLFGIHVQNAGSGYKEGNMLTLHQPDASKGAVVEVMQVSKQNGGIVRVSMRVSGEGHVTGRATSSGGGNDDATFLLTPGTKSQKKSLLKRLAIVVEDVRKLV